VGGLGGRGGAGAPLGWGGAGGMGGGSARARRYGTTAARAEAGRFPGESEKTSIVGHEPTDDRAAKGNTAQRFSAPDPEVSSNRARRRFTVAYKLEILRKADACTERGQLGVLLRREGLYASSVISWRRQREQGVLDGLTPRKRGRKARPVDPLARKLRDVAGKRFTAGVVLYDGETSGSFGDRLFAVPVRALWEKTR